MLQGSVHPDFSSVAKVLTKQLTGIKGGAAVAVYHQGQCVVDIWGGIRNEHAHPWEKDTLALSFSTTKGVASTLLHIMAEKKLIEYDSPVCRYWPNFAHQGKSSITVRQVLCHEAGLFGIRSMVEHADEMTNWEAMMKYIEESAPVHEPGQVNGYHGLTFGYIVGEIIRRVSGMTFSEALHEFLANPLKLDGLYCGLPGSELGRRALLIMPDRASSSQKRSGSWRKSMVKTAINGALWFAGSDMENTKQSLLPKGMNSFDFNNPEVLVSCIPSANGMFTARSLAKMYSMIALGGEMDGVRLLSEARIRKMGEIQNTRRDKVVHIPMKWRMGYHRVFTTGPKTPQAFGHFGYGGSGAWCDPSRGLAVAMTLNSGLGTPFGDSRIVSINNAAIRSAEQRQQQDFELASLQQA